MIEASGVRISWVVFGAAIAVGACSSSGESPPDSADKGPAVHTFDGEILLAAPRYRHMGMAAAYEGPFRYERGGDCPT